MERWLPIPGFEGRYEVSDLGRVRSLQRKGVPRPEPLILRDQPAGKGYRVVGLFDGTTYQPVYVHRAVLMAFRGLPADGMQGAHLDGVRTHNNLENLCWATARENHSHKVLHGTAQRGEASPAAKLTTSQVAEARRRWVPGSRTASTHALAREFGVSQSHMSDVLAGRRWGHVAAEPSTHYGEGNPFSQAGSDNPRAVLTEADVLAIRDEVRAVKASGNTHGIQALANRYGVCRGQIEAVAYGRAWKHLPGAIVRVAA